MIVGLRVDVDTLRGTRMGVPRLCRSLARHGIRATFFFSVGPDNMGRHLWRLARREFRRKMLRTRAASLYGWDILLRGTFWPGPIIGDRCAPILRAAAADGHEIGLHAWDHHRWQTALDRMDRSAIRRELELGMGRIADVLGIAPTCSAAPAWKCNDTVVEVKRELGFRYNSDCRGRSIFQPVTASGTAGQPQVPSTLPTYDEVVGAACAPRAYNDLVLSRLGHEGVSVHTIHAEVEGIVGAELFDSLLDEAAARGARFAALGDLLDGAAVLRRCRLVRDAVPGREGWVAVQGEVLDPVEQVRP